MNEIILHLKSIGVPEPIAEYQFAAPRRWRFDYAWPELKLAVEIEGGTWAGGRHVTGRGYRNDCEKYNAAAMLGWKVLRFTTDMVADGELYRKVLEVLR